jgi:hypothetical protein
MRAAGTRGAGTHREAAGELGLACGGERRPFLMTDADPLDLGSPDRVGERVQGVADQSKYLPDPNLFEHTDQNVCNRLGHFRSLCTTDTRAFRSSESSFLSFYLQPDVSSLGGESG